MPISAQVAERRLDSRFLCADLVRVAVNASVYEAILEDISPIGACIQLEHEIPVASEIVLWSGPAKLKGTVTYCTWRDYGYFAGIRLSEDTHWSTGVFMPQHLTNPRVFGK